MEQARVLEVREGQRSDGGKIVKGSVGQSKDLGLDSE